MPGSGVRGSVPSCFLPILLVDVLWTISGNQPGRGVAGAAPGEGPFPEGAEQSVGDREQALLWN